MSAAPWLGTLEMKRQGCKRGPLMLTRRLALDHPKSPPAARLKAALLYAGVRYDPCLAEAADWAFPAYAPHQLLPGEPPFRGRMRVPIPYLMRLADGTEVRLRVKRDSPFVLRSAGGPKTFQLFENDECLTDVTFEPRLPWTDALTADGTPMKATGLSQHGDMLVLNVAPGCEYFLVPGQDPAERTSNLSCTFCLYGVPDVQRMKPLGQQLRVVDLPANTLDRVAEACQHPETHARHLYLVGGSLLSLEDEGDRYLQIARHLAERGLHERYYVACGSGAIPRRHMVAMKDAGVRGACFNLEAWDPRQFERICPGKARVIGRSRWLDALVEAVDVFGPDNVMTAFVGGAELDGEGALPDPRAALESNLEGARWLLERGVQPIYSLFWKVTGKNRGEEPVYTLDFLLDLNEQVAELRRASGRRINSSFFCRRCAYMQLEPDYEPETPDGTAK